MRERPAPLPPDVTRLGWVSLLTDAASEAIYPVLPLFLAGTLGAPVIALGVIEGAAEATAACLRLVSGRLSDLAGRRKPLVLVGYGLSSAVRPFVALATGWPHVLAIRFLDRVGKGIRGAPRDAMLAALAPAGARGRVFGYHRAMDHAGAVVGPACAAAFLWLWPGAYRALFACAALPGALAVLALARVADTPSPPLVAAAEPRGSGLPAPAWRFFAVLALFTLGNASDAFILLRLSDLGAAPPAVAAIWGALHVVKSGLSTWGGGLSDRFGRRTLIAAGWLVYAVAYAGFAAARTLPMFLGWCAVYGVYYALAEGSEKALVADLVPAERRGTAFGWYHAVVGLGALVASVAFGAIWQGYGAGVAFGTGAALAVGAAAALALGR